MIQHLNPAESGILHLGNFALASINLAIFSWAIRGYFRPAVDGGQRLKFAVVCGIACTVFTPIAFWLWVPDSQAVAAVALPLYAGSAALFIWAATTNRNQRLALALTREGPTHLVITGPYRHLRHPFYTAYLLTWLAGVAALQHLAMVVPLIAMGAIYWIAANDEERRFLDDDRFAAAYRRYIGSTGRFVPKLAAGARP
ncbi:isoprenylcysteine carboxylmethyltransferase family protein [Nevskia sp.]|uniref:methyltransferase family protein n=1 Tax=Nevskia sp. TaxID=1929292 RepID=UPI0025CF5599|nr:isoprenylcysteine carboxylmethyltransferase family protein [Nevskia sp.]